MKKFLKKYGIYIIFVIAFLLAGNGLRRNMIYEAIAGVLFLLLMSPLIWWLHKTRPKTVKTDTELETEEEERELTPEEIAELSRQNMEYFRSTYSDDEPVKYKKDKK